jgi:hypothetical protein
VEIIERYGRHGLRVEQPDDQIRLLPVAWTDLLPRSASPVIQGRVARLAPEALRQLSAWVVARMSTGAPEKLDSIEADARNLKRDAAPADDGVAVHHRDGEGPSLVEQAGPPCPGRRSERQKRGRR